jgi:hypothetical protein
MLVPKGDHTALMLTHIPYVCAGNITCLQDIDIMEDTCAPAAGDDTVAVTDSSGLEALSQQQQLAIQQ